MAKKDFSTVNTEPVYNTIAEATAETQETPKKPAKRPQGRPRRTFPEYEAQEYKDAGKATGDPGVNLPRINMIFSQTNYDYIRTMSRVTGMTLTDFVNKVVFDHYQQHKDLYQQAMDFKNRL